MRASPPQNFAAGAGEPVDSVSTLACDCAIAFVKKSDNAIA